jgi:hypothetical protein
MAPQQVPLEDTFSEADIAEALAGTEKEKFQSAFGHDDDLDGPAEEASSHETDTSLEEMEDILDDDIPQEEEEGEQEGDDTDALDTQEAEAPDQTPEGRGRTSSERLRTVIEQRRQIEQERDTLRAQLAAIQAHAQMQQRPQSQQEQPAEPDPWNDPKAWAENERKETLRIWESRQVNSALAAAHRQYGDEFVAAYKELTSLNPGDPLSRATVQHIWDSHNAGESLMEWHAEHQALQTMRKAGGVSAYKQNIVNEIMSDPEMRRQILADMRGEAQRGDGGRPRTSTRLPKSLNGASGGGSVRVSDPDLYDGSDASVFAYAMKP